MRLRVPYGRMRGALWLEGPVVRCYLIRMRLARPMWGQRRRRDVNTNLTMTVLCLVMGTFSYPIQAGQAVGFTL